MHQKVSKSFTMSFWTCFRIYPIIEDYFQFSQNSPPDEGTFLEKVLQKFLILIIHKPFAAKRFPKPQSRTTFSNQCNCSIQVATTHSLKGIINKIENVIYRSDKSLHVDISQTLIENFVKDWTIIIKIILLLISHFIKDGIFFNN